MKRKILLLSALTVLALGCHERQPRQEQKDKNRLGSTDSAFLINASQANFNEIGAGKYAAQDGNSDSIKYFGQAMATNHSNAEKSLDSLSAAFEIPIPHSADLVHETFIENLQFFRGRSLDSVYINGSIADHQRVIALFIREEGSGTNSRIKAYIAEYLPVIQMDLQTADSLASQLSLR
ncbi:MAG TPA: DUF4142 domain-containing protein [Puia sp.]|nr:DUF4142 domain-containing protein [Puia sp.]